MARPPKLSTDVVEAWLRSHDAWSREGDALVRTYRFTDFSAALGFTVRVGLVAEKRDHHPDVHLGWGKARLVWTTHDAGGITQLDIDLAEASDALAAGHTKGVDA